MNLPSDNPWVGIEVNGVKRGLNSLDTELSEIASGLFGNIVL